VNIDLRYLFGGETLSTCQLRKFSLNDLESVKRIDKLCFPETYPETIFIDLHRRFPELFIVAEENSQIIGFIVCRMEPGFSRFGFRSRVKGHIVSIAILPEHRRKGVGSTLITRAIESMRAYSARQCYLEVGVTNEEAIALYKKFEFRITRITHGYYENGEDAYIMVRNMTKADCPKQ
jgi:ribosomal-protein-alanine N-acetyltransferase